MNGRTLLAIGVVTVLVPLPAWSDRRPPPVVYPTTRDQQSLEESFKQPIASDQPEQPAPAPAPTYIPSSPAVTGRGSTDSPPPTAGNDKKKIYKVWIWQENGDTLWRIAQKVYGDKDKWPLIYQANRDVIKDPNRIYPKQVLKIPPIDWQP